MRWVRYAKRLKTRRGGARGQRLTVSHPVFPSLAMISAQVGATCSSHNL
jgi:hypothetical protein